MIIYGKKIFDTSAIDGMGFPADRLHRAVEAYLLEYQRNNQLSEWLKQVLNQDGPLGDRPRVVRVATDLQQPDTALAWNCHTLDESQRALVGRVVEHINQQLQDWGMGHLRFSLAPPSAAPDPALEERLKNSKMALAGASAAMPPVANTADFMEKLQKFATGRMGAPLASPTASAKPDVLVANCQLLPGVNGQNNMSSIPNRIDIDFAKANTYQKWSGWLSLGAGKEVEGTVAHELAHLFGNHPQDVIGFSSVPPDMLEAMCEPGANHYPQSTLLYPKTCLSKGYIGSPLSPPNTFGALELASVKSAWVANDSDHQMLAVQESAARMMDMIRKNYGTKVAGVFAAAFCREMVNSVMSHAIYTHIKNPRHQTLLLYATRVLSLILQAALLSQNVTASASGAVFATASALGLATQTIKAMANLMGSLGLLNVMLALFRGNSYTLFALMSGFGGAMAGKVAAEMFNTLCACSLSRDEKYLESKLDQTLHGNPNALSEQTYGSVLSKLTALDNMLGKTIDKFVSGNFLYEKIFPRNKNTRGEPDLSAAAQDQAATPQTPLPALPAGMSEIPANIELVSHPLPTDSLETERTLIQIEEGLHALTDHFQDATTRPELARNQ